MLPKDKEYLAPIIKAIKLEHPEFEIEEKTENFEEMYLKLFGTKPIENKPQEEPKDPRQEAGDIATLGNTSIFENVEQFQKPAYKFIGIVFNTYIIIEEKKKTLKELQTKLKTTVFLWAASVIMMLCLKQNRLTHRRIFIKLPTDKEFLFRHGSGTGTNTDLFST